MRTRSRTFTLEALPLRAPDPAPDALAPVVLLPVQLHRGARPDSQTSGPLALMLALLEDAIRCLLAPGTSSQLAREAETWIRTDDPDWPMSFPNVCEALGIEAGTLRTALLARAETAELVVGAPRPWRLHLRRGRGRRTIGRRRGLRWADVTRDAEHAADATARRAC